MNTTHQTHIEFMTLALQLAERGRYSVSPNPMVGCVLVKDQQIVGTGYHQFPGEPHAEIHALQMAKEQAKDCIAYITLEPCCHSNKRTPPCTQALITAGIRKVIIACEDPNPQVQGNGVAALREVGIEVEVGLLEKEAQQLNEIFFHYMHYRRPFVIAKWAMSLDGQTITHAEDSRTISSAASHETSHLLRQQVDAILVGSATAVKDNPLLTARHTQNSYGKHPLRIVITAAGGLPLELNLFNPDLPGHTVVVTTDTANPAWCQTLEQRQIEVMLLPKNAAGKVELRTLLEKLGQRGITSLLIEGGMQVHQAFMQEHLINKYHVFIAPTLIGPWTHKMPLQHTIIQSSGEDIHISATLPYTHKDKLLGAQ